jgi:hypothetical protein
MDPVTPTMDTNGQIQMEILLTTPRTPIRNPPQTIATTPSKAQPLLMGLNRFSPLIFNA